MNEDALSKTGTSAPKPAAQDNHVVPEGAPPRSSPRSHELSKTHRAQTRPEFDHIILLLQGGGALGAYQAGVYEALAEADLHPDWVAGISIGSINGAIIAGNPPDQRVAKLRTFWEGITNRPFNFMDGKSGSLITSGDIAHGLINQLSAAIALVAGTPGFFQPRIPNPWFHPLGTIGATSYYDTSQLKGTLESSHRLRPAEFGACQSSPESRCGQCEQRQPHLFRLPDPRAQTGTCNGERRAASRLSRN